MITDRLDHARRSVPAILAIIGFAILAILLTSWDSYLYDLWQHHDVIWFYACGKAWMNGMTPYVDFADSKGPLLWLIYGIGYLLSPHDYVGCFWIACVLYAVIFYYCYKCALIFTRDVRLSLVAVVLSALFFLSYFTHIEVRTEDFCYPAMLAVLYRFMRHTFSHEESRRFARQSAIVLGVALGYTFLIKYSCTLMLAIFIPYFCIVVPSRCSYSVWRAIGWCALACVLTILPMVIVLALQGCLDEFINEYFLVTASTFDNMNGTWITARGVLKMFLGKRLAIFSLLMIAGMVLYLMRATTHRIWAVLAFIWFLAVIMLNGTDAIYFNVLSVFTVLFAGIIAQLLGRWFHHWALILPLAIAVLAALFYMTDRSSLFNSRTPQQDAWYYYATLMQQYDKPHTLYLMCHDHGEGVPSEALPACKYWSLQMGHTQEMLDDQLDAVKQQRSDVVFVMSDNAEMVALLDATGYHRYDFTDAGIGDKQYPRYLLYSRRPLDTKDFKVPTPTDILLKRHKVS